MTDTGLPTVTVFDPFPVLTVTIEDREGRDEVHLHAGGQGVWIGRMAVSLGASVRLITATGGEGGLVLRRLIAEEGITIGGVTTTGDSAIYVHDRRSGGRAELAEVRPALLTRHELDGLYEQALIEALDSNAFVLAGPRPGATLPEGTYRRLAADVATMQSRLVADLSGEALLEVLSVRVVTVLKLSDDELVAAGLASGRCRTELAEAIGRIGDRGATNIVVSRGPHPTLGLIGGEVVEVCGPRFTPRDGRGGGDAMTAALAVGLARGDALSDALRLGAAAGALNVTRRGLATVEPSHACRLAEYVRLEPLAPRTA